MGKTVSNTRMNRPGGLFGWYMLRAYISPRSGKRELIITSVLFTPVMPRFVMAMVLRQRRADINKALAEAKK